MRTTRGTSRARPAIEQRVGRRRSPGRSQSRVRDTSVDSQSATCAARGSTGLCARGTRRAARCRTRTPEVRLADEHRPRVSAARRQVASKSGTKSTRTGVFASCGCPRVMRVLHAERDASADHGIGRGNLPLGVTRRAQRSSRVTVMNARFAIEAYRCDRAAPASVDG